MSGQQSGNILYRTDYDSTVVAFSIILGIITLVGMIMIIIRCTRRGRPNDYVVADGYQPYSVNQYPNAPQNVQRQYFQQPILQPYGELNNPNYNNQYANNQRINQRNDVIYGQPKHHLIQNESEINNQRR